MILEALCDYYETLESKFGWNEVAISAILELNHDGSLRQVVCCVDEKNKKQTMLLPARAKRTSGTKPNFLGDNCKYVLGYDPSQSQAKSAACFQACAEFHRQLLTGLNSEKAKTLLKFFSCWRPENAATHPALQNLSESVYSANCVFRIDGTYVHEDPEIVSAWNDYFQNDGSGPDMVCLIDGSVGPAEPLHPNIKGVFGAQSSGASLISFNKESFCSYGKEQNFNAPISKKSAFAYTTALNTLLADKDHFLRLGDTTLVFWSKNGRSVYQDLFSLGLGTANSIDSQNALVSALEKICKGENALFNGESIDPSMDFYVLGLSPNAARLSVRFFLENSFGYFLKNIHEHYSRLEISRPSFDKQEFLPLWKLLNETVNQKSKDKFPSPKLVGDMIRAIITNTRYPTSLLNSVHLRIVADRDEVSSKTGNRIERRMPRSRAAILKAYYLKNQHPDVPKEVLTVALNENSSDVPYNLGRLFAVLEAIQNYASPEVRVSIKDKYFTSASASPNSIFPTLINLSQRHLHKLEGKGNVVYYEKLLTDIMSKFDGDFPRHLSLPQRGSFQLGYYHQNQARFTKKDKED